MIGALAGLLGVVVAYLLGRYVRMSELKFGLLQEAAGLYYRMNRAAAEYRHAAAAIGRTARAPEDADKDPLATLRDTKRRFESCLGDAAAVSDLMEQFFSKPVSARWNRVAESYMEIWERGKRGESIPDGEVKESIGGTLAGWQTLVHEAALECKRHPWGGAARWARQILRAEEN
jgi:hypothetical protein